MVLRRQPSASSASAIPRASSVHVLSEFFDRLPALRDRRATLRAVYGELYRPLTFTSLTTAVAFASLAIAPIPPVRVFGAFVAPGVLFAWLLTLVLVPAYVVSISEGRLQRTLGAPSRGGARLSRGLQRLCGFVVRRRLAIVVAFAALALVAVPGVMSITVNDNPVRWFKRGSDIRVATEELNARLPGTFNANLLLEAGRPGVLTAPPPSGWSPSSMRRWSHRLWSARRPPTPSCRRAHSAPAASARWPMH